MTKHSFHGGKKGTAIAVRIIPRSARNEIAEVLSDGSVKIRLTAPSDDPKLNTALVSFLSSVLGVAPSKIEVIGGETSHSKLVSVLDMDSGTAQEKIVQNIA
ncbi:MAG: hypothetical protein Fur0022_21630 [Anaerolineales bacterium]